VLVKSFRKPQQRLTKIYLRGFVSKLKSPIIGAFLVCLSYKFKTLSISFTEGGRAMVEKEHSVLVERREKLTIKGGVLKVHSFDDSKIILETKLGFMELSGEDIHIEELNLEEGDLSAKGRFDGLKYLEERSLKEKGKGILSKILK